MKRATTFKTVTLPVTETIPQRIRASASRYASESCQKWRQDGGGIATCSYRDFWTDVIDIASALKASGIRRADHVGIISDNRREWQRVSMALLCLGAADVPRGSDTTDDEIGYILAHSGCRTAFAENSRIAERILERVSALPELKRLIIIDPSGLTPGQRGGVSLESYPELLAAGKASSPEMKAAIDAEIDSGRPEDLATIIYTSGTTGEPKGVLLPHKSFIFQVDNIYNYLHVHSYDVAMVVLPIWHSYERAVEYIMMDRGLSIVHSKPLGSVLIEDMGLFRPSILPVVPRLMEAVMQGIQKNVNKAGGLKKTLFTFFMKAGGAYANSRNRLRGWLPALHGPRNRLADILLGLIGVCFLAFWKGLGHLLVFKTIHKKFGGRFAAAVVGGGALPANVDSFFQAVGIACLEGYGLTETGPILSVRQMHRPVVGTIGPIFPLAEYQVRDENGKALGPGQKGTLFIKSIQTMLGYYKKDAETAKVLKDGWLNTGDLAVYTFGKEPCIKIMGRIKDTIVLRGGKNIEPEPIEQKLNANPLIFQSMVVGQDQKALAALIVPGQDALLAWADGKGLPTTDYPALLTRPEVRSLYQELALDITSPQNGFKAYERVYKIALIEKPFEVNREMTQTLKIKRHVVAELQRDLITSLFN